MSSMPITAICAGDIVTTGYGTQEIIEHTVAKVEGINTGYDYFVKVTFTDGGSFSDTPGGFWYDVKKTDPEASAQADAFAEAYARAWDRKK
jgi:hypothetical protein